jgi:hypothetical protein
LESELIDVGELLNYFRLVEANEVDADYWGDGYQDTLREGTANKGMDNPMISHCLNDSTLLSEESRNTIRNQNTNQSMQAVLHVLCYLCFVLIGLC